MRDRSGPAQRRSIEAALISAALVVGAGSARADPSWATQQAAELTRQGREHAGRADPETAGRRFRDAIGFDATYGPAYLGLAALHEAAGDPREAERAYSMGLDHVTGFAECHLARGRLRSRAHRQAEAIADFEAAAGLRPDDLAIARELAGAYVAASALPAALASARRIAALAEVQQDARAAADAKVMLAALSTLLADVDPVAAGAAGRGTVRRALALAFRRR